MRANNGVNLKGFCAGICNGAGKSVSPAREATCVQSSASRMSLRLEDQPEDNVRAGETKIRHRPNFCLKGSSRRSLSDDGEEVFGILDDVLEGTVNLDGGADVETTRDSGGGLGDGPFLQLFGE